MTRNVVQNKTLGANCPALLLEKACNNVPPSPPQERSVDEIGDPKKSSAHYEVSIRHFLTLHSDHSTFLGTRFRPRWQPSVPLLLLREVLLRVVEDPLGRLLAHLPSAFLDAQRCLTQRLCSSSGMKLYFRRQTPLTHYFARLQSRYEKYSKKNIMIM